MSESIYDLCCWENKGKWVELLELTQLDKMHCESESGPEGGQPDSDGLVSLGSQKASGGCTQTLKEEAASGTGVSKGHDETLLLLEQTATTRVREHCPDDTDIKQKPE